STRRPCGPATRTSSSCRSPHGDGADPTETAPPPSLRSKARAVGWPTGAGGRIGEWVTGTVAAVAAAAAVWGARRHGHGQFVDVSMLEVHAVSSCVYSDLTNSMQGRPPIEDLGPGRSVE